MVARHALISSKAESVQILFVERGYDVSHILSIVIPCVRNFVRCFDRGNCKFGRWNDKTFVYKDVGPGWMIDHHQAKLIVIVGFPEFGGDPQIVITIMGKKLIASNLVPFLGCFNTGSAERVDTQADR